MRRTLFVTAILCIAIPPAYGAWWLTLEGVTKGGAEISNMWGEPFADGDTCMAAGEKEARRKGYNRVTCSPTRPHAFDGTPASTHPAWKHNFKEPLNPSQPFGKHPGDYNANRGPKVGS